MQLPMRCLTSESHLELRGAKGCSEGVCEASVDRCLVMENDGVVNLEASDWMPLATRRLETRSWRFIAHA